VGYSTSRLARCSKARPVRAGPVCAVTEGRDSKYGRRLGLSEAGQRYIVWRIGYRRSVHSGAIDSVTFRLMQSPAAPAVIVQCPGYAARVCAAARRAVRDEEHAGMRVGCARIKEKSKMGSGFCE
jgi:hypothetical protein